MMGAGKALAGTAERSATLEAARFPEDCDDSGEPADEARFRCAAP